MALTYFSLEKEHVINHYRFRPLKDGFLLTNDFGFWVYLSKEEFDLVRHDKIEENQALFSLLKEKGLVITQSNFDRLINDFRQRSRHLFRGTYHHVIFLDDGDFEESNIKKIADFILQSPSRELIVKFKGKILGNIDIMEKFTEELKKSNKAVQFSVEMDLEDLNNELSEFFIGSKFDIWIVLNNIKIPENKFELIKQLQRRHKVSFYLDVPDGILGKEQEIVDFFAENNFKSFFARKAEDINKDDFVDFWKKTIDYAYNLNKKNKRIVFYEDFASILLEKIIDINDTFYPELNSFCTGAIVSELAYTLDGNIYTNNESIDIEIFNIGNVDSSYSSVIGNEDALSLLSASINFDPYIESNVYKPYIGNCPVCNYRENGNIIPKASSKRNSALISMFDYLFEKILFDEEFLRFV